MRIVATKACGSRPNFRLKLIPCCNLNVDILFCPGVKLVQERFNTNKCTSSTNLAARCACAGNHHTQTAVVLNTACCTVHPRGKNANWTSTVGTDTMGTADAFVAHRLGTRGQGTVDIFSTRAKQLQLPYLQNSMNGILKEL